MLLLVQCGMLATDHWTNRHWFNFDTINEKKTLARVITDDQGKQQTMKDIK